jgi:hypothetical protein
MSDTDTQTTTDDASEVIQTASAATMAIVVDLLNELVDAETWNHPNA